MNSIVLFAVSLGSFCAHAAPIRAKMLACSSGQHWVQAHHRRAYIRADGTPVSATEVLAHCQSDPPSYLKWKERLKDAKIPVSWSRVEKRKNWTSEERERVFEALTDLPPILMIESVRAIFRSQEFAAGDPNPAAGDQNFIVLYDSAFSERQNLARVLAHEFAHEWFRQMPDDLRKQYAESTGWIVRRTHGASEPYLPGRLDFVEEDGAVSVTEDFANNIEYFVFDREKLKRVTPSAYKWIQRMIGDKLGLAGGKK